jgi:hypothetical protein
MKSTNAGISSLVNHPRFFPFPPVVPLPKKYLLMYREPMTVQEIATVMGISRERVRQILKDALEKLRNNPDCQRLREYLGGF